MFIAEILSDLECMLKGSMTFRTYLYTTNFLSS